jgi:hypothetical protein
MQQFSVRLSDEHGAAIKRLARSRGRSVNQTFEDLVVAATDPSNAGDEIVVLRERLALAGFTVDHAWGEPVTRPTSEELARASAAAAQATPLSEIVSEQRR